MDAIIQEAEKGAQRLLLFLLYDTENNVNLTVCKKLQSDTIKPMNLTLCFKLSVKTKMSD